MISPLTLKKNLIMIWNIYIRSNLRRIIFVYIEKEDIFIFSTQNIINNSPHIFIEFFIYIHYLNVFGFEIVYFLFSESIHLAAITEFSQSFSIAQNQTQVFFQILLPHLRIYN